MADVRVEHEASDGTLDVVVHLLVCGEALEHLGRGLLQRLEEASRLIHLQVTDVPRLEGQVVRGRAEARPLGEEIAEV